MRPDRELAAWLSLLQVGVGPRRLWDVMVAGDVCGEWERVAAGRPSSVVAADAGRRGAWRAAAAAVDPATVLRAHVDAGVILTLHGDAAHPSVEVGDPHVPPVLLWRGSVQPVPPSVADRPPRVGIIGTRRPTRSGVDLARELGRELTAAGCDVVSGLALGIDAAAHRGAVEVVLHRGGPIGSATQPGGPIGVAASGLDVVYPRRNRDVWSDVATHGWLCSEYPLGTPPAAWRFPARNRILVALSDVVVVVESHERGGSLITAGLAGERGVPVLAMPGSVRSPASVGTNRLLADGCVPCLGVDDVLTAVGLACPPTCSPTLPFDHVPVGQGPGGRPGGSDASRPAASPVAAEVLDAVGWTARSIDEVADLCPTRTLGALSLAIAELLAAGAVAEVEGRLERVR